ncbi:MAG: hypothetical protein U0793_20070 [Gemmataceae bacterium]
MLRAVSVPAENERGPLYMDQVLAAAHQGNPGRYAVTLAMLTHAGAATLCCRLGTELQGLVEGQLYAQYPDAKIAPLPDIALDAPPGMELWTAELWLSHALFPIKRYAQFDDNLNRQSADPLSAILSAIAGAAPWSAAVEITIRPTRKRDVARARRCLRRLAHPFFRVHHHLAELYLFLAFSRSRLCRVLGWLLGRLAHGEGVSELRPLDTSASRQHEREEDLQAASDKAGKLLFETHIRLRLAAPRKAAKDAKRALRGLAGAFGQFNGRQAHFHLGRPRRGTPRRSSQTFLLSTEELATLWHPPTATVRAPTMTTVESRESEPPLELPTPNRYPGIAVLGEACFRSRQEACGILPDDRRRHLYVAGKTGTGKSTLLRQLLSADIAAGRGVGLIDPHGDLCDAVLAAVPSHRTNDVIFFDAADRAFPIAFNVLYCPHPEMRGRVASGIVGAFKKLWGEFFGPRLEDILRNALLTLLEIPGTSLLSVRRLLSDADFRDAAIAKVSDPVVRAYWHREFNAWPPKFRAEAISSVQNKIGALTTNPLLRNIVGQPRSTLDIRRVLDEGKVLLCNFSKGRMGEDASSLLGSFLVTAIEIAAMSRADVPEERRRDFFLTVDEFESYATRSFATILSEARKYRLNLTIANQYLAQVEGQTLSAVWGNVGSMVVFQVGVEDVEPLAAQLGGTLTPKDLLALPKFHAYCRLLINGQPSRPFSLRTLPPPVSADERRPHMIRRYTRYRYARPAERVEREISRAFAA